MPDKRIKIGVIGAGRAGMIHAVNFSRSVPNACVQAIADPDRWLMLEASKALKVDIAVTDYKKLLDADCCDAIVVATPTKYHREIVLDAASAGKHILCEKPMAMNKDECQEMIAVAKKNNVKLQIGFMRRFDKGFMIAKERIDAGEIGDVVMVHSLTYGPTTPKPWMYDISKSNGPLAEVNSHDIDTLRWYTGSEFKEVYATAGNFRCPDAREKFPDFYDNVNLNASFENGMQGSICGAQGVQYGYDSRCEILGTKGIIFVGGLEDCSMTSCNSNGMSRPIVKSWMNLFEEAYLEEDKHFIECVLEDKEPKVTGHDGMKAVEVVNAGNRSINEKCVIHFSEEN